jgi:hypothetical protein
LANGGCLLRESRMRTYRHLRTSVAGALVCLMLQASAAAGETRQSLFYFENYKSNQMHYYALLNDCRWINSDERIEPEWVMKTKGGKPEKLGFLEGSFKLREEKLSPDGKLEWRIRAFTDSRQSSLKDLYFTTEVAKKGSSCMVTTKILIPERRTVELSYIHYELSGTTLQSATFYGFENGKKVTVEWANNRFRWR